MTNINDLADAAAHDGKCGCAWEDVLAAALTNLVDTLTGDYGKLNAQQREAYIEAGSILATLKAAQMGLEALSD